MADGCARSAPHRELARRLLQDWSADHAEVLADWSEENGFEPLAAALRSGRTPRAWELLTSFAALLGLEQYRGTGDLFSTPTLFPTPASWFDGAVGPAPWSAPMTTFFGVMGFDPLPLEPGEEDTAESTVCAPFRVLRVVFGHHAGVLRVERMRFGTYDLTLNADGAPALACDGDDPDVPNFTLAPWLYANTPVQVRLRNMSDKPIVATLGMRCIAVLPS